MEHERFELQNAPNTVEMAASSSKMLQIAENYQTNQEIPKISDPFAFRIQNASRLMQKGESMAMIPGAYQEARPRFDSRLNRQTTSCNML